MNYTKYIFIIIVFITNSVINAQVLTKQAAVENTIENNFGIKLVKNSVEIAKNNTSKYNTGELPTVFINSGANYGINASRLNYHNDNIPTTSTFGANTINYNASIGINYVLYDWKALDYTKQKLQENLNLADLEVRQSIENSLIQLFSTYYEIARIEEVLDIQDKILAISKQRLKRAKLRNEYGKSNKLQILNAEVDLNRDSINRLNLEQQLANYKRSLNLIMGIDLDNNYSVDTSVIFNKIEIDKLISNIDSKNIDLLLINKNIDLSHLNIKLNDSRLKPTLSAVGNYAFSGGLNDNNYQLSNQINTGLSAGLNLSWNLFDGGGTKVRNQNTKIQIENLDIQKQLYKQQIIRDIKNYFQTYETQKFVMEVEKSNLRTAIINFDRTKDQYNLGQVSSVEFRQAQLNILNSNLNYKKAKYSAKIAELNILQLGGEIAEAVY